MRTGSRSVNEVGEYRRGGEPLQFHAGVRLRTSGHPQRGDVTRCQATEVLPRTHTNCTNKIPLIPNRMNVFVDAGEV
jgi:hypothetical protein